MSRDLKRLFGLREMAVNVPDKDVPGLKRAVKAAVNSKILPPEAESWFGEKPAAKATEPKRAQAAGKKPAEDPFFADVKKGMTASKADAPKPSAKAEPKPLDIDLDDDWFQDDDDKKPQAHGPEGEDEFPSFPDSDAFKSQNAPTFTKGTGDEEDDTGPSFSAHNYGGGSSWEDIPDWMRDPEKMPAPGNAPKGRSINVPASRPSEPGGTKAPSPVGRPWSQKDVDRMTKAKKPGVLSRLFGRKAQGG